MVSRAGYASHLHIAVAPRQPMREMEQVVAVANRGFQNCIHGRRGSRRQELLIDSETQFDLELVPRIARENITTEGIRMGLHGKLQGRRGILCRVIEGCPILRGDAIEPLERAITTKVQGETRDHV